MAEIVLADSGAIVAALSHRDEHHQWAEANFRKFETPLLTCEAVLSESFFLLQAEPVAHRTLLAMLERGLLLLKFDASVELLQVLELMRRYVDTPMSFADACLLRMAELHRNACVITTDHDFRIYRKNRREMVAIIAPW